MSSQTPMDFSPAEPPADLSPPRQALWWLKKGGLTLGPQWERAHEICQSREGDMPHDWVHGLCHLIENDPGNAAYWFRRAGKPVESRDVDALWEEIAASI
ncbi:hypothetical protein [Roseibium marinum]|uniref:Uncharacterized protein n=1 Tax=Roseibium marinum TaxID=281252 RepID=A0A2S3V392_9HYPH|nr:hypothetical protein [Roseibium marinum]POF34454.1 hypothetical protein CLV41_101909 [Roseibium marinum]